MTHRYPSELASLHAVAVAELDLQGTLLEANAGFRWLIAPAETGQPGTNVAHCFLQPTFAALAAMGAGAEGDVYRGLLTIGDFEGPTYSLRGVVTRTGRDLRVLAEHDIQELSRLTDVVLTLNRDCAESQRDLAHANVTLHQLNTTLTQQKAELQATLDRVSRLEGILSICMHCKKVRTKDNAWQRIEQYVSEHSDAVFSHGMCPVCFEDEMRRLDTEFSR